MSKTTKQTARLSAALRYAIAEWRSASEAASAAAKQLRAQAKCKRHAEQVLLLALADARAIGLRRLDLTGGTR